MSEVVNGFGSDVFEMEDCELVGAGGFGGLESLMARLTCSAE